MKELLIGLLVGFTLGVCSYLLVDGALNNVARAATAQQQREVKTQIRLMNKLCPKMLEKLEIQP